MILEAAMQENMKIALTKGVKLGSGCPSDSRDCSKSYEVAKDYGSLCGLSDDNWCLVAEVLGECPVEVRKWSSFAHPQCRRPNIVDEGF